VVRQNDPRSSIGRFHHTFRVSEFRYSIFVFDHVEVHASTMKEGDQDESAKGFENLEKFFYRYLNEKYGVEEIAMAVAHSLLTATDNLSGENAIVQLWALAISGKIEDAAWRYWIQAKRLLMKFCSAKGITYAIPQNMLSTLIAMIYPGEQQDAAVEFESRVDTLAKGSVVLDHVFQCIASQLISKQEARFRTLMECLQKKDASNDMVLSFHMFSDVVVELAPSIPRMVIVKYFRTSAQAMGHKDLEAVSLDRLAYVGACLVLRQLLS